MEKEKYSEEYLSRKISEFVNLKHRCQRYWKKLSKESLKIMREKGLEAEIVDLESINSDILSPIGLETIPIYQEDGEIDDNILLKLSKQKFPGLYRRFQEDFSRYKELESEMKEIRNYFSSAS